MMSAGNATERRRLELSGVVQGVGFRPFVHRLATGLGLSGTVTNVDGRVVVEVEGGAESLASFERRIVDDAPPTARIASLRSVLETGTRSGTATGAGAAAEHSGFSILDSGSTIDTSPAERAFVPPDVATCDRCIAELNDPADRRFGHPFITCTNCGPRFTIIRDLPYDRPATTMSGFDMCAACEAEYTDPGDRRFHAQPIACRDCGPTLEWIPTAPSGDPQPDDPIAAAARCLADGGIVAIKGLGGFHIGCQADDDEAVLELRRRKRRPDKPFAVLVADLAMARTLAHVSEAEAELLTSPARPIVLCRARDDADGLAVVSRSVAPGNPLIGVMIAYTPVHHLLFGCPVDGDADGRRRLGPLVMTSGNLGGEPIAHDDVDALGRLGPLVDGFLTNDRPIHLPCDDSVMRIVDGHPMPIRRARGHAPMPIAIPVDAGHDTERSVLAVGGELKNAFCLAAGDHAWMSQHIGDMENLETLEAFTASVERFTAFYDVRPAIVAADPHPAYLSSGWARTNHGDRVVEVQHHHAHVAAVMAEHGLVPREPVLGVAFDGTGDGQDGSIWGGELLVADAVNATRVGHLRPVSLPGGDAAVRHPWRIALSHLRTAGIAWADDLPPVQAATESELRLLESQLDRNLHCVPTSSMGRFFDALASLTGLRHAISYEAQAAIELEIAAATWSGDTPKWTFSLSDPTPLLEAVVEAVRSGRALGAIALGIHRAIAAGVAAEVVDVARAHGLSTVALSGGVFQNALLVEYLSDNLRSAGLDVRTHRLVPPNDGGLALGQAYVARSRAIARSRDSARSHPNETDSAGAESSVHQKKAG